MQTNPCFRLLDDAILRSFCSVTVLTCWGGEVLTLFFLGHCVSALLRANGAHTVMRVVAVDSPLVLNGEANLNTMSLK